MAAVWYRFRSELRTRWRAWLALAVIVGMVGGVVLALVAGARRTDSAYRRFLRAQSAYDVLVLNTPSSFGFLPGGTPTASFDFEELRRLPEVADVARGKTFYALIGAGVGVLATPNDRIGTELNRFRMLEGRRPDHSRPDEVVVGFTFADEFDLEVGSRFQLLDPALLEDPPPEVSPDQAASARDLLEVLPGLRLTVVGIEASPGEFPPQIEGSDRYLIHPSPALYPLSDALVGITEGSETLMVRLRRGEQDADAFVSQLARLGGGGTPNIVLQRDHARVVERSFNTQAVALYLLAALVAVAGVLILGQLLARLTTLESSEHPVLSALGLDRHQRLALGLTRGATIGAGGALVAVAVAVAVSPIFPTGLARTAEPDPGVRLDFAALGLGVIAITALTVLLVAWPARRASRVRSATPVEAAGGSTVGRWLSRRRAPLPVTTGVRMALETGRGQAAVPVRSSLAGVTLGVVTLVAAVTFGASLTHLLATPRLYGQTWDAELTTYDATLGRSGLPVLEADDRVDGLAVGDFRVAFDVEGQRVDGLVLDSVKGGLTPTIIEGRRPGAADEIALGTRTLRSLDVEVGETVGVAPYATDRKAVRMRVVGRAVFPVFGEAGRLGDGVFVNRAGGRRIAGAPLPDTDISVLVRLEDAGDLDAVVTRVGRELPATTPGAAVIRQGKPTDIVNFGRVDAMPYILGVVLAVLSLTTLAHLLVSATRRRQRDLAVLKTLGFVRNQVRATVGLQATTLIVVALLVGIPIGIGTGRWIWTLFADQLGVVNEPRVPLLGVLLLIPIAVVVTNVVAAIPAAYAARTRPATVLRAE